MWGFLVCFALKGSVHLVRTSRPLLKRQLEQQWRNASRKPLARPTCPHPASPTQGLGTCSPPSLCPGCSLHQNAFPSLLPGPLCPKLTEAYDQPTNSIPDRPPSPARNGENEVGRVFLLSPSAGDAISECTKSMNVDFSASPSSFDSRLSRFQDAGSKESHAGCCANPVPFKGGT